MRTCAGSMQLPRKTSLRPAGDTSDSCSCATADPPRRSTRSTAGEDEDERAARELDAQLNG